MAGWQHKHKEGAVSTVSTNPYDKQRNGGALASNNTQRKRGNIKRKQRGQCSAAQAKECTGRVVRTNTGNGRKRSSSKQLNAEVAWGAPSDSVERRQKNMHVGTSASGSGRKGAHVANHVQQIELTSSVHIVVVC